MKDTTKTYLKSALFTVLFIILCSPLSRAVINSHNDTRFSDLYQLAAESSVQINREVIVGGQDAMITGSGTFIDEDLVITNDHVVDNKEFEGAAGQCFPEDNAIGEKVMVQLHNGEKVIGTVILAQPNHDIALIKLDKKIGTPIHLGNSDSLVVGQQVISVGSSLAITSTLGVGYVTGLHRHIELAPFDNLIQVSTGIFPGNSGGGLFDLQGRMVGIVFAGAGESGGIGFVIPINLVKSILNKSHHSFY